MSAVDEISDDELRANALNDPGFFLDLDEDDDDDVVLSSALPVPEMLAAPLQTEVVQQRQPPQQPQQQPPPAMSPPAASRFSGVGIPKLDVTALSNLSPQPSAQMPSYAALGTTNTPMAYTRDGAPEHPVGGFNPSSHNSSPHNATTSPNIASYNVYSNIACPPLCAKKLSFREFLNQKTVPQHIENEESTGIFVGQLPSSYSEDDIEALLKAIGFAHGQTVQVRDVKSHNRDRTCAFIMINASALNAVLDFTKRVLCDINCVWVVDHSQAAQLPIFVQQMPRDLLRGVPKAALVLEKLTPQSKPRHSVHAAPSGLATSPSIGGYASIQPNILSPMGGMSHPIFVQQQQQQQPLQMQQQQQQQGGGGAAPPPAAFLDAVGLQSTSSFNGPNFMPASSAGGNGLPHFFTPSAFHGTAASGPFFGANGAAPSPTSLYAMQMSGSGSIANIEAANRMMIEATRSRASSQNHQVNITPHSPPNRARGEGSGGGGGAVPTAVQLTPTLPQEHCSCGRMLFLSQYPKPGTCAKCNSTITPREVAYWCPNGHIAVCVMCALRTSLTTDTNANANTRFMQPQGEMMMH